MIKGNSRVKHGKYFYKLIWLGCISACIPLIMASLVYYQFSMERVQGQVNVESESFLSVMKDRSERLLQSIEQESFKLAIDPIVTGFLQEMGYEYWEWHLELLNRMSVVKNSDSFISEIYYYNRFESTVQSNRYGVIAKEHYPYSEDIDLLLASQHISQWAFMPKAQMDGYITYSRLLRNLNGEVYGVIAFEIEKSLFSEFMDADTYLVPQDQQLFVVHYQRTAKQEEMSYEQIYSLLEQLSAISRIAESDENTGRFIAAGLDGNDTQFRYAKNVYGRTYVMIVPEQLLSEQLNWIRVVTIMLFAIFVLFAILLTYFISRRAYNPISELVKHSSAIQAGQLEREKNELEYIQECMTFLNTETKKLGDFISSMKPTLQDIFLRQLVCGEYMHPERLLQDCKTHGVSAHAMNVILIADADKAAQENRFRPDEKGIIAFVISNVMQELMKQEELAGFVVPVNGMGAALLQFHTDAEQAYMNSQITKYAQAIEQSMKSYLKMSVSIGIGRCYLHIKDIAVSFKEAENALRYRVLEQTETIMYIEQMESGKKQAAFRYPREAEAAIIHALSHEDLDAAASALKEFMQTIKQSQSYRSICQSYLLLLAQFIHHLESSGGSLLDILEDDWYGQLQLQQSSQDVYEWFVHVLFPLYCSMLASYRSESGQTVIQQVCSYIRKHCGEDLSLIQCADQAGISPSYLSRLFKKEMGINFLDYVVQCKVNEAKRLLSDTDMLISEIAASVGYSERNLHRIFQRYTNVSPSTYRSQQRLQLHI